MSPDLKTGTTLAFFQMLGKQPVLKEKLIISARLLTNAGDLQKILMVLTDSSSRPIPLELFNFDMILEILFGDADGIVNLLFVNIDTLSTCRGSRCDVILAATVVKNSLKEFAMSLGDVQVLPSKLILVGVLARLEGSSFFSIFHILLELSSTLSTASTKYSLLDFLINSVV